MITDNLPKSSNFFDQQQVAPWWLLGIGSTPVAWEFPVRKPRNKVKIYSWTSCLVATRNTCECNSNKVSLLFLQAWFLSLGLWLSRPLFFSLQDLFCPRPFPVSKMVVLLSSCLNFGVFLREGELGSFYHLDQSPSWVFLSWVLNLIKFFFLHWLIWSLFFLFFFPLTF